MNQTLKVALIAAAVITLFKVADRLFLNKAIWSKLPGEGYYEEEAQ